jgi:ketosteroid isomerase-like protein
LADYAGPPARILFTVVSSESLTLAKQGLAAWHKGDFETLERLLDPAVHWHWFEPGDWDCHNREDVLKTLRERHTQGFAAGEFEFRDVGDGAVIVVSHPSEIGGREWPSETATVMRFRDEKVVSMQDYRTEPEARAALAAN